MELRLRSLDGGFLWLTSVCAAAQPTVSSRVRPRQTYRDALVGCRGEWQPPATEVWLEKRSVGTRRRDERASECSEAALRAMRRDSA